MTPFDIYWLVKLDDIRSMLGGEGLLFITMLSTVAAVVGWIVHIVYKCNSGNEYARGVIAAMRWPLRVFTTFSAAMIFALTIGKALIPSTRQMAAIIVIPKIANGVMANEDLRKLPGKVIELTGEWMEELRPKNVKNDIRGVVGIARGDQK
jgi:hypothetical protein